MSRAYSASMVTGPASLPLRLSRTSSHESAFRSGIDNPGASNLSEPIQVQPHRGKRRLPETRCLVHAGALGGGTEVDDANTRVRVEPGEQRAEARLRVAAPAVGRFCADIEHVSLRSADIVGAGSPCVAAAKCCAHDTVGGVFHDEAGELLRPSELLAQLIRRRDPPGSVLAADLGAHRREHQRTQMDQRRHILLGGAARWDLCIKRVVTPPIFSLRRFATESGGEMGSQAPPARFSFGDSPMGEFASRRRRSVGRSSKAQQGTGRTSGYAPVAVTMASVRKPPINPRSSP
jgi:hypothetical protein